MEKTTPNTSEPDPLLLSATEFDLLQKKRILESEFSHYKETSQPIIDREEELSKPSRQIITILNDASWMSVSDIASTLDLPIRKVTYLIYRLYDQGFIHFSDDGNKFEEALKTVFVRNTEEGVTYGLPKPTSEA